MSGPFKLVKYDEDGGGNSDGAWLFSLDFGYDPHPMQTHFYISTESTDFDLESEFSTGSIVAGIVKLFWLGLQRRRPIKF